MDPTTLAVIRRAYGFSAAELPANAVTPAPRQFVAETFFLTLAGGRRLFCKVVAKRRFVQPFVTSLPLVAALRAGGFSRLAAPVATLDGGFHCVLPAGSAHTRQLITQPPDGDQQPGAGRPATQPLRAVAALFDCIDAPHRTEFDTQTFGELTAFQHQCSPTIACGAFGCSDGACGGGDGRVDGAAATTVETFEFKYPIDFPRYLADRLAGTPADPVNQLCVEALRPRFDGLVRDWRLFMDTAAALRATIDPAEFVLTHGDAPGNVLGTSPTDLYIIDWDDILFAPPQRDLWFFAGDNAFLRGYTRRLPEYREQPLIAAYYVWSRFFADIIEYLDEIWVDASASGLALPEEIQPDEQHRRRNLDLLINNCLDGWLVPAVSAARRQSPSSGG